MLDFIVRGAIDQHQENVNMTRGWTDSVYHIAKNAPLRVLF